MVEMRNTRGNIFIRIGQGNPSPVLGRYNPMGENQHTGGQASAPCPDRRAHVSDASAGRHRRPERIYNISRLKRSTLLHYSLGTGNSRTNLCPKHLQNVSEYIIG